MKFIYLFLLLTFGVVNFSFRESPKVNIEAKVLSVEYYEISECSVSSPILARVTFHVDCSDVSKLKMKIIYTDEVSMINEVLYKDKKGNFVYDFCTQVDKNTFFKTVFIDNMGNSGNEVFVYVNPSKDKVISGTAPQIFKIN